MSVFSSLSSSSFVVTSLAIWVASALSKFGSSFARQFVPACRTSVVTPVRSAGRRVAGTAPGVERISTLTPASLLTPPGAKSLVNESPSIRTLVTLTARWALSRRPTWSVTVVVAAAAVTVAVAAAVTVAVAASALVVVLFSAHHLQWWSFAVAASVAAIVVFICATMRSSIAFNMSDNLSPIVAICIRNSSFNFSTMTSLFTCTFAMLIFVGSVGE